MSLRPNTVITITQQGNDVFPASVRNKVFSLDFCNSCEISSSWTSLTDTAKIKIPRNIIVEDETGDSINFGSDPNKAGANIYGGNGSPPLMMRGDKISISLGYFQGLWDSTAKQFHNDGREELLEMNTIFIGYITKIKNRAPIEIECEDEMWKLKLLRCPNKLFPGSQYTVQQMIAELINGDKNNFIAPYKITDGIDGGIKTNVGDFRTQNETVAQVLERLRKDGGLYSYFRINKNTDGTFSNELRCSGIVYYPQDRNTEIFAFQENIIKDELEYTRKEDLNIAVKAHAEFLTSVTGNNLDGSPKTKRQRVEVMVDKNGVIRKEDEKTFHGDIIIIPVLIPNNIENLDLTGKGIKVTELSYITQKAKEYLPKFYYTGFRGAFSTFGLPNVRHGDAAHILDNTLPEREGIYLIKQVITTTGMQGFRQKITLHLRIDIGFTQQDLNAGITG